MTTRPLPRFPEPDSEPFWRATKDHELTYQRCDDCKGVVFYPRGHCPQCGSDNLSWHTSAGRGSVYAYTIIRQSANPAFPPPYVVAWIDLDEGFRLMSNVVDAPDVEQVQVGTRVEVKWEDHDELAIPLFRPTG